MLDVNVHAYRKKLRGWLSYAFARYTCSPLPSERVKETDNVKHSEVFVIVSLTLFLPICLEQFARDNGYLMPDRKARCVARIQTQNGVAMGTLPFEDPGARCQVKIGWFWVDTASFR